MVEKNYSLADFKTGDRVLYIPLHAHGDRSHEDCEWGTVNSVTDLYVFVRFDSIVTKLGYNGTTSQACKAWQLTK